MEKTVKGGKKTGVSRRKFIKTSIGGLAALGSGALWKQMARAQEIKLIEFLDGASTASKFREEEFEPAFNNAYKSEGIKSKILTLPQMQQPAKFLARLAARDPFETYYNQPVFVTQLAQAGVFAPLDELPGYKELVADMFPACKDAPGFVGDNHYYMPNELMAHWWIYNKPMWEKLGGGPLPTSYDEIKEKALEAKEKKLSEFPIVWVAGKGVVHLTTTYLSIVAGMGDRAFNDNFTPRFKEDIPYKALKFFIDTSQKWKIADGSCVELRYYPAARRFGRGDALFHLNIPDAHALLLAIEDHPLKKDMIGMFSNPKMNVAVTMGFYITKKEAGALDPEITWKYVRALAGKDPKLGWMGPVGQHTKGGLGPIYNEEVNLPEEREFLKKTWPDVDKMLEMLINSKNCIAVAPPYGQASWWVDWNAAAQTALQNAYLGQISVDECAQKLEDLTYDYVPKA